MESTLRELDSAMAGTPLDRLGSRLRLLGVVEPRLLRDLLQGGAVSFVCEVMGMDPDNLGPEVLGRIFELEVVVGRMAKLELQRLAVLDYPALEDAVLVLKRKREEAVIAGPVALRPLPGKYRSDRLSRRKAGHLSLKAKDVAMRTKWEARFLATLDEGSGGCRHRGLRVPEPLPRFGGGGHAAQHLVVSGPRLGALCPLVIYVEEQDQGGALHGHRRLPPRPCRHRRSFDDGRPATGSSRMVCRPRW